MTPEQMILVALVGVPLSGGLIVIGIDALIAWNRNLRAKYPRTTDPRE